MFSVTTLGRSRDRFADSDHSEVGATMVEFALVAVIFGALLFTFLDLAHYLAVRSVMIKGAQDALQIAVKSKDFQLDFDTANASDDEYQTNFVDVRNEVVAQASQLAMASLVSEEGSGSFVEIENFAVTDTLSDGTRVHANLPAAIIRPGETWQVQHNSENVPHPYEMEADEKLSEVLRREPVIVHLRARKNFFLPIIFDSLPIQVSAVGWTQVYPEVGFNVEDYLSGLPDDDDPPDDPDDPVCEVPPYCASDWNADKCCCGREPTGYCQNNANWVASSCNCDCNTADPCPHPEWTHQPGDCWCNPCEKPPTVTCSPTGCWDDTICACADPCPGA